VSQPKPLTNRDTITPIAIAPLPPPAPNPSLKQIRRPRQARQHLPSAALIPLFYAALLFLAGIVLARYQYLRPGLLLAGLLPLGIVAALAIWKTPRLTWLPIGAIWLVLGIWSGETEPAPAPNPAIAQLSNGLLRTVVGTVADSGPLHSREAEDEDFDDQESMDKTSGEQVQRIDLQLTAAEIVTDTSDAILPIAKGEAARLRLSIVWPANTAKTIDCGQPLRAVVRILPPDTFHDPGVWSRIAYLEAQAISATASVAATRLDGNQPRLTLLNQSNPTALNLNSAACLLSHARNSASSRLQTLPTLTRKLPKALRASPEDAAMLTALLTGDRTYLTRDLRAGFERTGSFHLVVVSGLHLAILAGCIFALSRRLRLSQLPATALTIAVTLGYALFTGFAIPAQRSFWMIALYLIGRLLYRNRSPLNVIGFATLCLAAASPRSIFDASLQMTLLSVAAIAGIAIPLLEHSFHACIKATKDLRLVSLDTKLSPEIAQFRVTLRLIARHLEPATSARIAWQLLPFAIRSVLRFGEVLFVTLVVELALSLPMAIYFHRITVYALPVNLCILPLLGILVPAAMLLLLILTLWPAAAIIPATICLSTLHLSVFIVHKLGALSLGDLRIPDPAAIQIASAILLFVLAIQLARGPGIQRRLSFAALLLGAVTALWPRPVDHARNALLFEAIDVGQGDSLLLISPDGKTLLVDAGGLGFLGPTSHTAHSEFDVGDEVVSAVLWSRGIRRLDAVALTHAHHDHMGGLPAILRNFHPRELWVGNNPIVPAYKAVLQQASDLGTKIRGFHAGDTFSLGEIDLRVLAPRYGYLPGPQPANNDSLVLQARYRSSSILLAGDAEAPEEESILTQAMLSESSLQSTLLKVGHHGSVTSTHPHFLSAVAPAWAVISCGRHNRFGHPRPEILAELQSAHTRTYRTDTAGAACFFLNGESDGKSVTLDPMCSHNP
jgi:competence protein ComEC